MVKRRFTVDYSSAWGWVGQAVRIPSLAGRIVRRDPKRKQVARLTDGTNPSAVSPTRRLAGQRDETVTDGVETEVPAKSFQAPLVMTL